MKNQYIEAAQLAYLESKDETHFLPLPLFVPIAEFDSANQCIGCGMSVTTEMIYDGKTRRILVNASEMFTKTFPLSAPSLADVNRELKKSTTAMAAVTSLNKSFNEQKNSCARVMILGTFLCRPLQNENVK